MNRIANNTLRIVSRDTMGVVAREQQQEQGEQAFGPGLAARQKHQ